MSGYGQFCPMAKAMDVLDERWTLLVVRELLLGSRHFNDLRRGLPRMSPALLSKRLKSLTRAGVVERTTTTGGRPYTDGVRPGAGRRRAVATTWGTRWVGQLGDHDLDPHLLMWDIGAPCRSTQPRTRTVVAFHFNDVAPKASRWWLAVADGQADVCDVDPGYDVTATVESPGARSPRSGAATRHGRAVSGRQLR